MWSSQNHADFPKHLEQRASAVTRSIASNVAAKLVGHFPSLNKRGKVRIAQLIQAMAWTEAALTLVEIELPQWKLRRLVYDDGEWLCSLSRQPNVPIACDCVAEARHEALPLAVLGALDEAKQTAPASNRSCRQGSQKVRQTTYEPVSCDNFA